MRTTTMHTTMSLVTVLSMAGVATAGQSDLRLVNAAAEHRMETVRALLDADVDVNRAPLDWACA